ncbi:MAG: sigma-70 family RNA polymerase sigma factor [Bacteroidales bacterium]|nr:sigma-70 family RNA polymerase sigma factor [Bacteroidales bacterium]
MPAGTATLQRLLDEAAYGQPEVYDELLQRASDRLLALARWRMSGFPGLQRWSEADDVVQNAMMRLHRCLTELKPPTVTAFFGLAALQIRRELLDLTKSVFGPEGIGANHHTDSDGAILAGHGEMPTTWERFYELTEGLPGDEKQVVDLLFVHDMTPEEAAAVLGVSLRTVKRRWLSARTRLGEVLRREQGEPNDPQ